MSASSVMWRRSGAAAASTAPVAARLPNWSNRCRWLGPVTKSSGPNPVWAGIVPLSSPGSLAVARLSARSIHDRVAGVSAEVGFKRLHDAPSMDPDTVVQTLQELVAERSHDVFLFQALSNRFLASAEEFFPPQIDALLAAFAELGYADKALLKGFVGRLGDLTAGASPRRVVRLLRNGATLRLPTEDWLPTVLVHLDRHLPNLREGLPSVLASLDALRHHDEEFVELLLTQGLIVAESMDDVSFSTRLLERWSRHGIQHGDADALATSLVTSSSNSSATCNTRRPGGTFRDSLNILAALQRMGASSSAELEAHIESRLRADATVEEAIAALLWMERLALRSSPLWRACADAVELGLKDPAFVRDHFPEAVHALASLLGPSSLDEEIPLLASLLNAAETRIMLPRLRAHDSLCLVRAACLAAARCESGSKAEERLLNSGLPWVCLADSVSRMHPQFTLPERRVVMPAVELLQDLEHRHGCVTRVESESTPAATSIELAELLGMRLAPLPPVPGKGITRTDHERLVPVDAGPEMLLSIPIEGVDQRSGIKILTHGDTFAAPAKAQRTPDHELLTPSCMLSMRAFGLRGWTVELRA